MGAADIDIGGWCRELLEHRRPTLAVSFYVVFFLVMLQAFLAVQMATPDVLKLRVVLDEVNAERLNLLSRPETVNALILELKNKMNLNYDFHLQFQDPEFGNALCNLVSIEDLPSKATDSLSSKYGKNSIVMI